MLKDENEDMKGIRLKGKVYDLDDMCDVNPMPSRQDGVDVSSATPDSPQLHEYASLSGHMLPDSTGNEWDLSLFDAMSFGLSPFLTACDNGEGEDLQSLESFAPSFGFHTDFDTL